MQLFVVFNYFIQSIKLKHNNNTDTNTMIIVPNSFIDWEPAITSGHHFLFTFFICKQTFKIKTSSIINPLWPPLSSCQLWHRDYPPNICIKYLKPKYTSQSRSVNLVWFNIHTKKYIGTISGDTCLNLNMCLIFSKCLRGTDLSAH